MATSPITSGGNANQAVQQPPQSDATRQAADAKRAADQAARTEQLNKQRQAEQAQREQQAQQNQQAKPVVNTQGQVTGQVVNTVA